MDGRPAAAITAPSSGVLARVARHRATRLAVVAHLGTAWALAVAPPAAVPVVWSWHTDRELLAAVVATAVLAGTLAVVGVRTRPASATTPAALHAAAWVGAGAAVAPLHLTTWLLEVLAGRPEAGGLAAAFALVAVVGLPFAVLLGLLLTLTWILPAALGRGGSPRWVATGAGGLPLGVLVLAVATAWTDPPTSSGSPGALVALLGGADGTPPLAVLAGRAAVVVLGASLLALAVAGSLLSRRRRSPGGRAAAGRAGRRGSPAGRGPTRAP
ncbi:hypothetical protein FTX61_20925 [Nitriliruptoraceae bacterium ZYF776]|nr:hypothetical protein [Profundirhabdus halotolerans]